MNSQRRMVTRINEVPAQGRGRGPQKLGRREMMIKGAAAIFGAPLAAGIFGGCGDGSAIGWGPGKKQATGVSLEDYTIVLHRKEGTKLVPAKAMQLSDCIRRIGDKKSLGKPSIIVFTLPVGYPRADPQCEACLQAAQGIYSEYNDVPVLGIQVTNGQGQGNPGEIAAKMGLAYPMATMDEATYNKLRAALGLETVRVLATNWEQKAVFHAGGDTGKMKSNLVAVLKMMHNSQPPRKYVNVPAGAREETALANAEKRGAAQNNAPQESAETGQGEAESRAENATTEPAVQAKKPDGRMEPMELVEETAPEVAAQHGPGVGESLKLSKTSAEPGKSREGGRKEKAREKPRERGRKKVRNAHAAGTGPAVNGPGWEGPGIDAWRPRKKERMDYPGVGE